MISLRAQKDRFDLRLLAYTPVHEPVPEGCMKVVYQVFDNGTLIPEPFYQEARTNLELADLISQSRWEGWEIEPWKWAA